MRKGHRGSAPAATRRRGQHMTATARRSAQAAFLVALRDTGSVRAACRTSALGKSSVYRWAASDRAFRRNSPSIPHGTKHLSLLSARRACPLCPRWDICRCPLNRQRIGPRRCPLGRR
jgi:hypothetical protein